MDANEPANPCPVSMGPNGETCFTQYNGLTKRELIAAMCLQGLLANTEIIGNADDMKNEPWMNEVVAESVANADSLIAETSKEQTK